MSEEYELTPYEDEKFDEAFDEHRKRNDINTLIRHKRQEVIEDSPEEKINKLTKRVELLEEYVNVLREGDQAMKDMYG